MLARGHVVLDDTLEPGGSDIRRLSDIARVAVDSKSDSTVRLEIETARGTFGGDTLAQFDDYRLPLRELREIATPIVTEKLGADATESLFNALQDVESVQSVSDLLALTVNKG